MIFVKGQRDYLHVSGCTVMTNEILQEFVKYYGYGPEVLGAEGWFSMCMNDVFLETIMHFWLCL